MVENNIPRFEGDEDQGLPSPSLAELMAYHAVVGGELFLPQVRADGQARALAACTVADRQVHHMPMRVYEPLGHDLYDYPQVWARTSESLTALFGVMRDEARSAGADAILFPTVVLPNGMEPPAHTRHGETCLFDARREPSGWAWFVAKKSLRYQRNKIRKAFRYEVVHKRGEEITPADIAALGRLHEERWAFDGIESKFSTDTRAAEYLCYPANKILTTLTIDGEVLAMNFGMAFGETFLWHTVVVNVKYLDLSPLQVLLLETAEMCDAHGFQCLDFGVGDEPYKERFANARRTVYHIFQPLSARARLASASWSVVPPERLKRGLHAGRQYAVNAKIALEMRLNRVLCYETVGAAVEPSCHPVQLEIPQTYTDFVEMARRLSLPPSRLHYDRYKAGSRFAALHDGETVVSQGWTTREEPFWIGELDRYVPLDGAVMLYDFETPVQHRRRGHYTRLLRGLLAAFPGERVRIFALSGNTASNKAILKAGFSACELWPAVPAPNRNPPHE
jgi:CelD/BcsL family acetyltransferase involved in cellulose biosynthesis